jgi:hypothetical protein
LGSILWCEAEAAQAINLSRAKAWKLPLQSIELPRFKDALTEVQLDKKEHREAVKAAAYSEDVKLIVVDSLRGAHSKDENASETIQIVMWLAQLARDTNKPILLTHHLRKRSNNDSNTTISLDRLRGSSAILQPARVIWAMNAPNQDDPEVKQLSVIKSNLGAFPEPIGFMIDEEGIEFCDPPMSIQKETSLGRAEEKILQLLALNGGALQTEELYIHLDSLGISKRTAKRAKKSLNISAQRKDGKWYWLLPN